MKEEKINNRDYEYQLPENSPLSAQNPQGVAANRTSEVLKASGKWTRRSLVSCLLGSLLLMLVTMAAPPKASAAVDIFVSFGPPAIPVYEQPYCPGPGYMWTPGYWAWDPDYGYYWVPGTWVPAPFVGAMWTPGYWGWYNGGYMWYPGYWGTAVGFYGGIDYGYGYNGRGYYGGYWRGDNYYYNREVNHINNVTIVNVYNQRVVENNGPRISYNGGRGGIDARPTSEQRVAERTRRFGANDRQIEQERWARSNPAQHARENHGRPEVAATARPGEFRGNGVVRATRAGAPYNPPAREMRRGSEAGRPSSAPVERRPQNNAPQQERPNQRMERPAPQQAQPNRQMERQPQPNQRMERPAPQQQRNERPMYRNDRPPQAQQQRESRPSQARPNENRGAQERQARPQNEGRREGGNNNNNNNNNHPPHR
ncbi:MAG TPA: hypothetical protein VFL79_02685 [Terriglobia bacterium]|nr:hypothetical protein [Terriglobia bacterium]